MAEIIVSRIIEASVAEVWAAWDDYEGIQKFNPNLKRSFLLDEVRKTGHGALRQCDFADGKNHIKERVIEYIPERRMVVDIYDGTVPLKSARAIIELSPVHDQQTRVDFTFAFTPKMGMIGRLMIPVIKRQFRPALARLLDGNKAYVERGETVAA